MNSAQLLILKKGDLVVDSIQKFAARENIKGALIQGLGAIKNFELGYYHLHTKTYERKWFKDDDYELLSLNGNIAIKDGAPFVHVHVAVGEVDFSVRGGHLFEAEVAVTVELGLTRLDRVPERHYDDCIGLYLIDKQI